MHRVTTLLLLVALALPAQALGEPSTPEIETALAEAAAAQATLDEIAADLEESAEEYYEIEAALDETRQRAREAQADFDLATQDLIVATERLSRRATAIYRGGRGHVIEVFLDVSSFSDFLVRMDLMRTVNRSDAVVVASVKDARARIESSRRILEARQNEQVALRDRAKAKQAEVERALARQEAYLNSLNDDAARLIAQERERQRQAAELRARQAAAEAAARAAAEQAATELSGDATTVVAPSRREFDASALGAGQPRAVELAMTHLGVPYAWGGSTPAGFDCSGLTWYVYRQLGIVLPRNSRSQFLTGAHIPPDRTDLLTAGDLVFFGRGGDATRIHHVGIYVGGGDYVHAPQTGDVVRVQSLTERIRSRGDYVGASRF